MQEFISDQWVSLSLWVRLIFSLLAELLYLLKLKGYLSVSFTTFGYRQLTFLSTYPWEMYPVVALFALLTFLSVWGYVCVPFWGSFVHLFSAINEISSATLLNGNPLQGTIHICWTVSPSTTTTFCPLCQRYHCFFMLRRSLVLPRRSQGQMIISKVLCPRVLLPASYCPLSLTHDLISLFKLPPIAWGCNYTWILLNHLQDNLYVHRDFHF